MAFQTVRDELQDPTRSSFLLEQCGMNQVTARDAEIVLDGLVQLQRVVGKGTLRNELLLHKLFPAVVYHPSFKVDDRLALASCMVRAAATDPTPTPISVQRKSFRPVLTSTEPSTAVPPAPNVSRLARKGIADARVMDGWESDGWFNSPDGQTFVAFWSTTHPKELPALELSPEERITALLFFGLQAALTCLQDMVQEQDAALEGLAIGDLSKSERQSSITNVIQVVRNQYKDAVTACAFVPKPAENFADGFELMIGECWTWSEHLRLASDDAVDVSDIQTALAVASTVRHEFIQIMRKLKRVAKAWTEDPATSTSADKALLDVCAQAMQAFERLNCAAGSLPVPSVPSPSLQGLQIALTQSVSNVQRPFRGTLATCGAALAGGADSRLSDVTMQRVEGRIHNWKDVEVWFATLPASRGAGIAFLWKGCVLLPTDAHGTPKDKWLGGKLEPGETWWQAACREVDEETFVRSDPWVHRLSKTSKPDARLVSVEGEPMPWRSMASCPLGSVLIARSAGLQLERDVEHPCSVARISTRDLLAQAFDALSDSARRKLVASMRVALEVNGSKSYRTLVVPMDDWCTQGRLPSLTALPQNFKAHAKSIEICSAACFADVFVDEPLDVDWASMKNWEEEGFAWVPLADVGPRIGNVLHNKFNR